jgi:hypothetical protein
MGGRKITIKQIDATLIPDGKIVKASGGTLVFTSETTGVVDGDKGDIIISNTGQTYVIDQKAVTYDKIQDTLNTNILIGRYDPAGGVLQEIMIGTGLLITGDTLVSTAAFFGSGGTSGEINTASNLGTGIGLYSTKVGSDLRFKSIMAGPNIIISGNSSMIIISGSPSGEINTASNVGTGVELFKQKNGFDLEFKTISGTPNQITVISGSNLIRLALPQDIAITSSPTFLNVNADNIVTTGSNQTISGVKTFVNNIIASALTLTVTTGKPPLVVSSSTMVVNLNADLIDSIQGVDLVTGGTNFGGGISPFTTKVAKDLLFRGLTGRTNQIIISASTSLITFSLPQDIGGTSVPQFGGLNISNNIVSSAITVTNSARLLYITGTTNQTLVLTPNGVISATTIAIIANTNIITGGTNFGGGIAVYSGNNVNNLFFRTLTGRTNQIIISASTNLITFALPQDIGGTSVPQFGGLNITNNITTSAITITNSARLLYITGTTNQTLVITPNGIISATTIIDNGEVNTASNIGGGVGVFSDKSGVDLRFKTFSGTSNQVIISASTDMVIFRLPQDIATTSSPTFRNITTSAITVTNSARLLHITGTTDQILTLTPNGVVSATTIANYYNEIFPEDGASSNVTVTGWTRVAMRTSSSGRGQSIVTIYSRGGNSATASVQLYWGTSSSSSSAELRIVGGHLRVQGLEDDGVTPVFRSVLENTVTYLEMEVISVPRSYWARVNNVGSTLYPTTPLNFELSPLTGTTVAEIPYTALYVKDFQVNLDGSVSSRNFITASGFTSTVPIGTAPLVVNSSTLVNNLNVQYFDGLESSDYVNVSSPQSITGVKTFNNDIIVNKNIITSAITVTNSARLLYITGNTNLALILTPNGVISATTINTNNNIGTITGGTNLGSNFNIFSGNSGNNLFFRTIIGGGNISISGNNTTIIISGSSGASGEVNTASNIGNGVDIFANKSGDDLRFRTLSGTPNQINIFSGTSLLTFGLPQDIATTSSPTFNNLNITNNIVSSAITITNSARLLYITGTTNQTLVLTPNGVISATTIAIIANTNIITGGTNFGGGIAVYSGNNVNNLFFRTLTGRTNQIIISASTDLITFSLPQDIGGTSSVNFSNLNISNNIITNNIISGGSLSINRLVVASAFTSTVSTGTQPISVQSRTLVTNLNASLLVGQSDTFYVNTGTSQTITGIKTFVSDVVAIRMITASALTLTVRTGMPPLVVSSSTMVVNLNADMIDNIQGNQLITGGTNLGGGVQIFSGNTPYNLNFRTVFGDPTIQISANTTTATIMYKPIIIVTGDSPTGVYPDGAIWIQI